MDFSKHFCSNFHAPWDLQTEEQAEIHTCLIKHIHYAYLLPFCLQENVGDAELKQQKSETDSSEEQENTDETLKETGCLVREEAELGDALKHVMRQGSLLSTTNSGRGVIVQAECLPFSLDLLNSVEGLV